MPSGTTYNPPNVSAFVKSCLNFDAQGVNGTITAGTTNSVTYTLTDDCLLTGLEVITNNGNYGDTANFQVTDSMGNLLEQVATNWNVVPSSDTQFDLAYPAKILAGMILKIVYTSTGTNNVFVAVNFKLHKCLI